MQPGVRGWGEECFSTWGRSGATAAASVHSVPRHKEEGGKLALTSFVGSPLSCAILVSASADPATPLRQRQ